MAAPTRQAGAALLLAIFVMVVGALIAAALARVLGHAAQGTSLLVGSQRTEAAALAGLEWAANRIEATNSCASGLLALGGSAGALDGINVSVSCQRSTHDDAGTTRTVYEISAFAQHGNYGSADYATAVERDLIAY